MVDLLSREWAALLALAADFTDADWTTPTDLPGWDVKDNYAHIVGTERSLQGVAAPELGPEALAQLSAPSAPFTEPPVAARRHLPGTQVLAELRDVTDERLAELRALSEEAWGTVGPTPLGELSTRDFMAVRVFDCWMHEQDVRRALGRPGHQDGPVVEHALGRCARALAVAVGKRIAPPDGTTVAVRLTGPMPRILTATVTGGRAAVTTAPGPEADPTAGDATVTLTLDQETFWCVGGGRWAPDRVLDDGKVAVNGDHDLGERLLRSLPFMI
jgi:uncharacterized protein (TIGR03083 family)